MKFDSRHNPTSVLDFLQRHEGAAGLMPTADRLLKLRRDLLTILPAALLETCEVSGFDDQAVVLRVSSASAAAKLRQMLPRMRDGLIDRGWNIGTIRIRVKPRITSVTSTPWRSPQRADITSKGVEAFSRLGSSLEDSPLKSAIERLVRRRPGSR
jgi:hypothetical protein